MEMLYGHLICYLYWQDLLTLEAIKSRLQEHLGREPTLAEWAKAADMEVGAFSTRVTESRQAKDRMIQCNLRLVVSVAKKYQNRGMSLQDLIQVGKALFCDNWSHRVNCELPVNLL